MNENKKIDYLVTKEKLVSRNKKSVGKKSIL